MNLLLLAQLAGMFGELSNAYKKHAFLLTGGIAERMNEVKTGYEREKAIREELGKHFGAAHVMLSNEIEQTHWEHMKEGHGFKLYFEDGKQPPGWYKPEEWGNRQSHWSTYVYLPPSGSADQKILEEANERLEANFAQTFPGRTSISEWSRNMGLFIWRKKALAEYGLPEYSTVEEYASGAHVLYFHSTKTEIETPPALAGCIKISEEDYKALNDDPEGAQERINRLLEGKSARTLYERARSHFPLNMLG